ncbi:MAG: TonB family protein [Gammaproteobacteria bacterium]|nr:TonB family protein [Gammaproteobacteria bacterium]NND58951.1 energy transducer TonB [Gammaproteobacteria bacterium]
MTRTIISASLGVIAALGLFVLMHQLLMDEVPDHMGPTPTVVLDVVHEPKPERTVVKERRKPVRETVQRPPQAPRVSEQTPTPPQLQLPEMPIPDGLAGGVTVAMSSGEWQGSYSGAASCPIRIGPVYPREGLRDGTTGTIEVQFIIQTDGRIADPVITRSDLPRSFERSVLQAISKWKCDPRRVNGEAIPHSVSQIFNFELD